MTISPPGKERFRIHLRRFEKLVDRQWKINRNLLLRTSAHSEGNNDRRCTQIVIDTFRRQQLLNLSTGFERRFDRLYLYVQLKRILGRPLQRGHKVLQCRLRFVSIVQSQPAQILAEFTLYADL
uniref:Uncharacterized protein n=1 Tax=Anopheles minimus TaxID=112268 RepID=A0A182VV20_9DIPT